jgi:DNA (cytosine-5)-methyltransferase 1
MPDKDNFNCVISSTDLCLDDQGGQQISVRCDGKAPTLRAEVHGNIPCVIDNQVYSVDQGGGKSSCNVNEGQAPTRTCTHGGEPAVCYGKTRYIVRRLTPLECERLQGYPDGWTDIGEWIDSKGKKRQASDALRYKCLGNSIALPVWKVVLKRLCACYERDATMASLFSGIGGFDLLWTQLNGKDSVLWESEIDDFPSAVCKRHFGDEADGTKGDFYEYLY